MHRSFVAVSFVAVAISFVAACGSAQPKPVVEDARPRPSASGAASGGGSRALRPVGALGVYRLIGVDAFPRAEEMMPNPLDAPKRGAERWYWGLSGLPDGTPTHYVLLRGAPDDVPHELHRKYNAPSPTLPSNACLLYQGQFFARHWTFRTVAIEGATILTVEDLAACTLDETPTMDNEVKSMEPAIELAWTAEGMKKLRAFPRDARFTVAFGDEALTDSWDPNIKDTSFLPARFRVQGINTAERWARARVLLASCEAQRKGGVRQYPAPVDGCASNRRQ